MTYAIHEANMERLQKHMTRIRNKCEKYGCEFKYAEVGEEFRKDKDKDGNEILIRFVLVDVEGTAMLNDWEFIAELEHTKEGNIIHKVNTNLEVPERYYFAQPICEHCGTNRWRKNTYIVHNVTTDEYKQVGKSCLKDFTHGLSAEGIAAFLAGFDKLAEFETPPSGGGWERYVDRDMFLRYVAETVRLCGYVKRRNEYEEINPYNTIDKALMIMMWRERGIKPWPYAQKHEIEAMIPEGFDANGEKAKEIAQSAFEYVNGLEGNNNYVHNLQTVIANQYVSYSNIGLLASAIPYYNRYVERCEEENRRREAARKEAENSDWIGNVGDRLKGIKIVGSKVIWSGYTDFGMHYLYKMLDQNHNILIWSTGKELPDDEFSLSGTIKELKEYNGTKETVVTRCSIKKGA